MPRKTEIPKKPRFNLAAEHAYKLLVEIGAEKLPISTYDITNIYPNIHVEKYTEHIAKYGVTDDLDFDKRNAIIDKMNEAEPDQSKWREHLEAMVFNVRGETEYLIVFDDRVENKLRRRWSVGHEMGHIFCGHLIEFELTSMFRSGLTPEEYGVLEIEAHFFASELFGPTPVLLLLNTRFYTAKISVLCGISFDAAIRKVERLNTAYISSDFDNYQLLFNFNQFIFSKGYLQSMYMALQAQLRDNIRVFWDIYDVCRVCPSCGVYRDKPEYIRCHICGAFLETPHSNGRRFPRFEDLSFLDGKIYPAFEEDKNQRALLCPVCKNSYLKGEHCNICNTPLYNRCLHEGKKLPLECRKCPSCGGATVYGEIYDAIGDIKIPRPSRFKGYDRYEWWGFVQYMLKTKAGMGLELSNSAVYTDDDYFVLVTAGDKRHRQKLLDNLPVVAEYLGTYGLMSVQGICLYHYDRESNQIFWITASDEEAPFSAQKELELNR